jgi:hypothetical protein
VAARTVACRGFWDPFIAREEVQTFLDALMKAEFEPIMGNEGMSVLRNIPPLEAGTMGNIVVRNMAAAFWEVKRSSCPVRLAWQQ